MVVDPSLYKVLEKQLTYSLPSYNDPSSFVTIKNINIINYNINGGKMLVAFPVGRTDLIPDNYTIEDKRILNTVEDFPEFKFELREAQQQVLEEAVDNCIVNAKPGWGKTFWALAKAAQLKQKTLVVTHTVDLRQQWEKEIQKTLGIKPGIIGSGKFNTDSPIVVANVQTLTKNVNIVNREFGLVLLDEMHHVSSPTFSKVIDAMFARFKIGLSGTIERKDQKHVVFKDYFGSHIIKPAKENTVDPEVHVYDTGIRFADGYATHWSQKVNLLLESQLYRNLVVQIANKYNRIGHKVLVVADRVDFLEYGHENCDFNSGLLVGKTKDRETVIKGVHENKIDTIWGTQSMVSEGLSIEPLSCLVLATPLNNIPLLEQLIGRIERLYPNKLKPVVVDLKLLGYTVTNQFNNRLGHYMRSDYDVNFIK